MKKLISILLVFTMVFMTTISVCAKDTVGYESEKKVEIEIQNEINNMEEYVWIDLYNQLAAQDALGLYETFKELLRPEIEAVVYEKYGISPLASSDSITYTFKKGGLVSYISSPFDAECVDLCMNKEDTLEYFYDNTTNVGDLILLVLGVIPGTQLIGLAANLNLVLTVSAKANIKAAGYYSRIKTVSTAGGTEKGTYAYAWDTHPTHTIYSVKSVKTVKYGV